MYQAYKHVIRGQVESVYQRVRKRPNGPHVTQRESQTREQLIDWDPWSTTEETSESEVASAGQELARVSPLKKSSDARGCAVSRLTESVHSWLPVQPTGTWLY